MRLRNTNPTAVRSVPFTLIELLTVMLIVGVLLAVTVPVIVKITSGSSVEAASRMVGAQLRLARQEAITKRKTIAVLLPSGTAVGVPAEAKFQGFRACYVDSGDVWQAWVPNAAWAYVPVGAVIAEADDDNGIDWDPNATTPTAQPTDGTVTTVTGIDGDAAKVSRAIVFKASGRLESGQRSVSITEGVAVNGGADIQAKNKSNWIDIRANQYTGRVTFVRPGA